MSDTVVATTFDFEVEGENYTALMAHAGEALQRLFGYDALTHIAHIDMAITTRVVTGNGVTVTYTVWAGRVTGRYEHG